MKRKAHNTDARLTNFRLDGKTSQEIPFGLLQRYIAICSIDDRVKEVIYDKCRRHDPRFDDVTPELHTALQSYARIKDVEKFRSLYQAVSLLSKYPFTGNKQQCRSNAIDKFWEAERMCQRTNRRLSHFRRYPFRVSPYIQEVSIRARRIIKRVLGDLHVCKILDRANPGPGLTNDLGFRSSQETTKYFKYTDNLTCTRKAHFYSKGLIARDPRWLTTMYLKHGTFEKLNASRLQNDLIILDRATCVVSGNRITFVPKNSTTDRTIAIEPSGNVMLQAGVGSYIKDRLLPFGINLRDQGKNQRFAYLGSLPDQDDEFSTIDLRMASDTVSYETVKALLPSEWFAFLCDLRSEVGTLKVNGSTVDITYEKFSSMGNGYTFEIESLIFYALSRAVMETNGFKGRTHNHLSVFGDDVVCRKSFSSDILHVFRYFGFKINLDKSFIEGPFKESCGKDFLNGVDVRPFFLRRKVRTLRDLHFVCNSIMYKALTSESYFHFGPYEYLFACIPKDCLLPGPLNLSWVKRATVINGTLKVQVLREEKRKFGEEEIVDDLESCLRVPLSWALEKGHYRLSHYEHSFMYREISTSPCIVTKRYKGAPFTTAGMYHTFLQGVRQGDIVLRGVVRHSVRWRTSSSWDGCIPRRVLSYALV